MNPCVDAVLKDVAGPTQIAAISSYSQDPRATSVPMEWAMRYPAVGGSAEDVIAARPDLVIAGPHVSVQTIAALQRLGIPLMQTAVPETVAENKAQITAIAARIGQPDAGALLNRRIDAALAQSRWKGPAATALIWQGSGLVPGEGTLADELLTRTGFRNLSAQAGLRKWDRSAAGGHVPEPAARAAGGARRHGRGRRRCEPHAFAPGAEEGGTSFPDRGLSIGPAALRRPGDHSLTRPSGCGAPRTGRPAMKPTMKLNLALLASLCTALLLSLMAGRHWIAFDHWLTGDLQSLIVMELRLPRACAGALVGLCLGLSGAAMQGYLRNPLADPGLFGVSSSAALGAVISLFFGYAVQAWLLPIFALAGAAAGMAALALLAGRSGSLILFTLAGVILASLSGAFTSLLISLAPTPFASSEIVTWPDGRAGRSQLG